MQETLHKRRKAKNRSCAMVNASPRHSIFLLLLAIILIFQPLIAEATIFTETDQNGNSYNNFCDNREIIRADDNDGDLVWAVQLSDLHFSVHHPERAQEFREIVGPTLSFIKPSLVLVTGDLTDGKSKDLLTMKQDEKEWIEYKNIMHDIMKRSGLENRSFYDVRGNHDNFGVPTIGGSSDYYSKYSINSLLNRNGKVNSVTMQTLERKVIFVGFDSTMSYGLRGPTNLFGHPTDELLADIDSALSQWDSQSAQGVTKVTFGHFPLSFSAATESGKTLRDLFIKHSLAAYICGHLHVKFGENLKRHHRSGHSLHSSNLFQLNGHQIPLEDTVNCSATGIGEFWELEMGDWRRNRAMRVLAVDRGRISFTDIDFKLGAKKTIILPTFPLDSRFTLSSSQSYECNTSDPFSYRFIRALIFSSSPVVSVNAKIYDSSPGKLVVVLETAMTKIQGSHDDLYVAPWNSQAFEDPSPDRYLLQIEVTDAMGRSTASELRPFSVNNIRAKVSWSWKESLVMGCQWDSLYLPILWGFYLIVLCLLIIPKIILSFSKSRYAHKRFKAKKSFISWSFWTFTKPYDIPFVWHCLIGYLFYLVLCPWFYGQAFTEGTDRLYMTYWGWVMRHGNNTEKLEFLGFPDVMVVVLAHLYLVVLPAIVVILLLASECGMYRDYILSMSSKKDDDDVPNESIGPSSLHINGISRIIFRKRWLRKFLLVLSLGIFWKHLKSCVALRKAYEMNPMLHFPLYSLAIPLLLAYVIWRTGKNSSRTSTK